MDLIPQVLHYILVTKLGKKDEEKPTYETKVCPSVCCGEEDNDELKLQKSFHEVTTLTLLPMPSCSPPHSLFFSL